MDIWDTYTTPPTTPMSMATPLLLMPLVYRNLKIHFQSSFKKHYYESCNLRIMACAGHANKLFFVF